MSVPGGIAGKSVCPKGAQQVEVSVSGGLQAKSVCPRDACRQKCLSQGVCRQNLSVLGGRTTYLKRQFPSPMDSMGVISRVSFGWILVEYSCVSDCETGMLGRIMSSGYLTC